MTTPAIKALRQCFAQAKITLLASSGVAPAIGFIPEIDDSISYNAPWVKSAQAHSAAEDLHIIDTLKSREFDAAIIFTVFSQNPLPAALLCYLAQIPIRCAHCRENPYQLLTHWLKEPEPHEGIRHEVLRQLALVNSIGAHTADQRLSWQVPVQARQSILRLLAEHKINAHRLVVIHPGATAPSRRYPGEKFAEIARHLITEDRCDVIFTGQKDERPLIDDIQKRIPLKTLNWAGELDLGAFSALLTEARLLISNNTGPVHIAAAVGTPVVDIYALTNPQHTPWQVEHRVLYHDVPCKYCFKSICPLGHHNCLELLDWQDVVAAAEELLEGDNYVHTRD